MSELTLKISKKFGIIKYFLYLCLLFMRRSRSAKKNNLTNKILCKSIIQN